MELRKLSLERYKGYAEPVEIELAPLTILVGANNAGKTALAQAIQLFAGDWPLRKTTYRSRSRWCPAGSTTGILSRIW